MDGILRAWHLAKERLQGRTARELGIVLMGHTFRLGLGIVSSAFLARGLTPSGLSVFTLVSAWVSILGTFADFGLRNSAVRQIARQTEENPTHAKAIAAQFGRMKMAITLGVVFVIGGVAGPLARLLNMPLDSGKWLVVLGCGWVLATAFSGTLAAIFQALRLFTPLMTAQTFNITLTVILMAGLYLTNRLTPVTGLIVGGLAALSSGVFGLRALPPEWRRILWRGATWDKEVARELWRFGKWVWIGTLFAILHAQLDILLVSRFVPQQEAGYYALAFNLAQKALLLYQTLYIVFLPQASALKNRQELRHYLFRNMAYSLLMVALIGLTMFFARPAIEVIYGAVYLPSVSLYSLLALPVILELFALPITLLIYPLNLPRLDMVMNGLRLALLVSLGLTFIPQWGIYGAAVAKILATLGSIAVVGGVILYRLVQRDGFSFREAHIPLPDAPTGLTE